MKTDKIWSFMIKLSVHIGDDENTLPRGWWLKTRYEECNNVNIEVWDEIVSFLAKCRYNMLLINVCDAIKYESRPEISAPDAWDKDFLRKKLNEARSLGLEVIPMLNFSCKHHTWLKKYRRMVSTPEYYAACADVIRETCEVFDNPRFIHLGMDEEQQVSPPVLMREAYIMRGENLWWHDMFFYFKEAEKYGVQPWVWSDYYWNHSESFLAHMPKSVLQSNWFYNRFKDYPAGDRYNKRISTYEELDKHGYKQVLTMSNCEGYAAAPDNPIQTMLYAKERMLDENVKGFMMAPWSNVTEDGVYLNKDGIIRMLRARESVYPDSF